MTLSTEALPVHGHSDDPGGFEIDDFIGMGPAAMTSFPHRHSFYEVAVVTAGSGTHVIDFDRFPIRPPSLYVIAPGQVHYWELTSRIDGKVIVFSDEFLVAGSRSSDGRGFLGTFHDLTDAPSVALPPGGLTDIITMLDAMQAENTVREPGWRTVIQGYLDILLVRAARLRHDTGSGLHRRASGLAREYATRVSADPSAKRTVGSTARELGVTAGHLADVVREVTGRTPSALHRDALSREARRLLVHTDLSVAEVGYELGFDDPSYFCRFFRRENALSPGTYRTRVRDEYHPAL